MWVLVGSLFTILNATCVFLYSTHPPPTLNLMTFISVRGQTSASYTFLYILHFIPLSLAQSPSAPRCLLSQACA